MGRSDVAKTPSRWPAPSSRRRGDLVTLTTVTLFDEDDHGTRPRRHLQCQSGLRSLLTGPGIGPVRALALAAAYSDLDDLAATSHARLEGVIGKRAAETLLSHLPDLGALPPLPADVQAISCFDENWPTWLNDAPSPPVVVYVRGSIPPGGHLGIVGTRHPTDYGLRVVERAVEIAAETADGIVSGLAFGIDIAAHRQALRRGLRTWAVLGCGVDRPTPDQHAREADEILAAGGGLLSEQPPGTPPNPRTLVARNRLQVAASRVLLVAQSGIPSGTLHTARFALEIGRTLVVPRPRPPWSDDAASAGNMALTDPNGCSPKVLEAQGALAKRISARHPVADVVLNQADELRAVLQG